MFRSKARPGSIRMTCLGKKQTPCTDTTKTALFVLAIRICLLRSHCKSQNCSGSESEWGPDCVLTYVMWPGITALVINLTCKKSEPEANCTRHYMLCVIEEWLKISCKAQSNLLVLIPMLGCKIPSLESKCLAYFSFNSQGWFMPVNAETPPHNWEK